LKKVWRFNDFGLNYLRFPKLMKQIFLISIFCLAIQTTISAQNKSLSCPKISIRTSASNTSPNSDYPATFSASIEDLPERLKLEYFWSVSHGKIVSGQGTSIIEVDVKERGTTDLKVVLEIIGLPERCGNTFVETVIEDFFPVEALIFHIGYGKVLLKDELNHLNKVLIQFKNNPDVAVFFELKFKGKPTQKQIDSRILRIRKYFLEKKATLFLDKVTFQIIEAAEESTDIYFRRF
jgi:hypothetical protein